MNKIILSALTAAITAASTVANATLEPRLNGQAYYDTETNLTWSTATNPNGSKTWDEQIAFLANFTIDGIGNWRIPTAFELSGIVFESGDCPWPSVCLPGVLFDTAAWYERNWVVLDPPAMDGYGVYYSRYAYTPFENSFYPSGLRDFDDGMAFHQLAAWPVHTGDVASISQVPEPATYAMLLAGLGLVGFANRKKYFKYI